MVASKGSMRTLECSRGYLGGAVITILGEVLVSIVRHKISLCNPFWSHKSGCESDTFLSVRDSFSYKHVTLPNYIKDQNAWEKAKLCENCKSLFVYNCNQSSSCSKEVKISDCINVTSTLSTETVASVFNKDRSFNLLRPECIALSSLFMPKAL